MSNPRAMADNQVFREDFRNAQAVLDNGGVITGALTIDDGVSVAVDNAGGIAYNGFRYFYGEPNKYIIKIKFRTGTDIASQNILLSTSPSPTIPCLIVIFNSEIQVYFDSTNTARYTVVANTDYDFTIVYDGAGVANAGRVQLYFDGVAVTPTFGGTIPAKLSTSPGALEVFQSEAVSDIETGCKVYNMAIFEDVWTADEALDAYENDTYKEVDFSRAIVHLPMITQYNDGTQKTVNEGTFSDSIGVGDGSTASSYPTIVHNPIKLFSFDGSTDYLKETVSDFQGSSYLGSFSFWIKPKSFASTGYVIMSADTATTNHYFSIGVNATTGLISIAQKNDDTADGVRTTNGIVLNYWSHVVMTSDGTTWRIYIDGVEETLTVTLGSNTGDWFADTDNRDNLMVGVFEYTSQLNHLNADLKDVSIWDFTLTARQITWLIQRGLKTFNL